MTYKEIQEIYRNKYQKTIKSCWIADVKRGMGFPIREAYNRENPNHIKNWCKNLEVREKIEQIIKQNK